MKSSIATPEQRVRETEGNVQEEIWKFIAATLRQGLRKLVQGLLEDEVTAKVKARRYERSPDRMSYRGGHYRRSLLTRYGLLENLRVPRVAEGSMDFQLFDRYERRRSDVDAAIGRLFLQGVSTRRLRSIARAGIPHIQTTIAMLKSLLAAVEASGRPKTGSRSQPYGLAP